MRRLAWSLVLVACDSSAPKTYGPTFDAAPEGSTTMPDGAQPPSDAGNDALAMDSGGCTSVTALLAGTTGTLIGASRVGGASFKVDALNGGLSDRPALAAIPSGFVGVLRSTNDALQSTVFSGSFSDPVAIGAALTRDAPALTVTTDNVAHVVYQSKGGLTDYKFFHGQFAKSAWDTASDPVGGAGPSQSYGPRAPAVVGAGTTLVVAQGGDNSILYDQIWTSSWMTASAHNGAAIQKTISPAMTALSGGSEDLLVVYARDMDYKIMSTARANNAWSQPALVDANAFLSGLTNEPVALAPMGSGKAVMVYRGTDSKPYFSIYNKGSWTAPAPLLQTNPSVDSLPSVATGVCGADAIAAYVESGAGVKVTALSGGTWSAPDGVPMSTGTKFVAVATKP